jgi:hypothetical protein
MSSRLVLWPILLSASLSGCYATRTTDLDDDELFFRFKANGTLVEFTTLSDVYGVFIEACTGSTEALEVVGWSSANRLGMRVSRRQTGMAEGTYSIARRLDDPTFRIRLYYRSADGIDYFAAPSVPEDVTLVISRVGSSTIDGTFFGVVKADGQPDVVITDGEFTVRREHTVKERC